jgi:hypothetical protein
MAEDGIIPERYPLMVLPKGGYRQRTRLNVSDSDGTAILYNESLKDGTRLTRNLCALLKRPYVLINAAETPDYSAMRLTPRFSSGPLFRRSTTLCVVVDRSCRGYFEVYRRQ